MNLFPAHEIYYVQFNDYLSEYYTNEIFKEIIDSGNFVFVDNRLVINDKKYVKQNGNGKLKLTKRVYISPEDCCLAMIKKERPAQYAYSSGTQDNENRPDSNIEQQPNPLILDKISRMEALKNLISHGIITDEELENRTRFSIPLNNIAIKNKEVFERSEELKKLCDDLTESIIFTQETKQTFAQMAWSLMENRKCTFTDDFTKKTLLSVKTYNRIKSGELVNPKFDTAMAVCIGLNLGITYAIPLLKSAGFDLEQSSAPLHKVYHILLCTFHDRDIYEWNEILAVLGFPQIKGESAHKTHENSDMK